MASPAQNRHSSAKIRELPVFASTAEAGAIPIMGSDILGSEIARAPLEGVGARETFCAFVADRDSERLIRECVGEMALPSTSIHTGDIAAAIAYFETHRTPRTLLVDISGMEPAVTKMQQLADVCEPIVTVLAIGDRNDVGLFRDLLDAGVSNYFVKPLPRVLLQNAMAKLVGNKLAPTLLNPRAGQVVSVIGTHGGVGTSTIAANLAWGLANKRHRQVALVDLDLSGGSCDLMLGVRSNSGLREALERPDRIDELFVERSMIPCGGRLSLLSSHESFANPVAIDPLALAKLIGLLRREFHYVVLDAPRGNATLLQQALDLANTRVLVVGQTLVAIRDMLGLRKLLDEPREGQRNLIVLNRHGEPGTEGISRDHIEQVVGLKMDAIVPFDAKCVVAAANYGQPLLAGKHPVSKAIAAIVDELGGHMPTPPIPWWKKFLTK